MKNMIEGINYMHSENNNMKVIEGARLIGDSIHIDVHDHNGYFEEFHIMDLTETF